MTLPIEMMTEDEFSKFREKYLDSRELTPESLEEIENISQKNTHVSCCEYHAHNYPCLHFENPYSGIIMRLLYEIRHQQGILSKINKASIVK
jgi:hypothetical protein